MISSSLLGALGKIRQADGGGKVGEKGESHRAIAQSIQPQIPQRLALNEMQERIINYLGAGISAEKVASAVGCDPSYISQLLANDEIAQAVSSIKMGTLTAVAERDRRLDALEDRLISKAETALDNAFACVKPMEAIRALHTINSLKRRGDSINQHVNTGAVTVKISLPKITMMQFTVDINNQVIKADDTSLVTIASGQVQGLASTINEDESYRQVDKRKLNELTIEDLE